MQNDARLEVELAVNGSILVWVVKTGTFCSCIHTVAVGPGEQGATKPLTAIPAATCRAAGGSTLMKKDGAELSYVHTNRFTSISYFKIMRSKHSLIVRPM